MMRPPKYTCRNKCKRTEQHARAGDDQYFAGCSHWVISRRRSSQECEPALSSSANRWQQEIAPSLSGPSTSVKLYRLNQRIGV